MTTYLEYDMYIILGLPDDVYGSIGVDAWR